MGRNTMARTGRTRAWSSQRAFGAKIDYYSTNGPYHRCVRQRALQNGPYVGNIYSCLASGSYSYNSQRGGPGGIPSVASFSTSKGSDTEKVGEDDLPQSTSEDQETAEDALATPPPPPSGMDIAGDLPSNLILDTEGFEDLLPEEEPERWEEEVKIVQITKFGEPESVVEEIELDNEIFGLPLRVDILQRVVRWQLANKRKGLAKTKDRGEVSGGGKKPWKQKGTGRARAGSIRAPHWRGGGRIHGPRGGRDWSYKLNKKVRRLGMKVALSAKYRETKFAMIENLMLDSHKTSVANAALLERGWDDKQKILFIHGNEEDIDYASLALGNIQRVQLLPSRGANVYSILYADIIVITKPGLEGLTERLIKKKKSTPVFLDGEEGHADNSNFKARDKLKRKSTRERHEGRRGWIKKQVMEGNSK